MPPFLSISSVSMLLLCLEPLALPSTFSSPSSMPTTGLMFSTVPATAAVRESLPPRIKYSRVSTRATRHTLSLIFSSSAAMAGASIPPSLRRRAYSTRIRWAMVTFLLSTTQTLPG